MSASVQRLAEALPAVVARLEGRRLAAVAQALAADIPGHELAALSDTELIDALLAHGVQVLYRGTADGTGGPPAGPHTEAGQRQQQQKQRQPPLDRRSYELLAEALVALRVAAGLACRSAELAARGLENSRLVELACNLAEGLQGRWPGAEALACLRRVVLALPASARQAAVGEQALVRCAKWAQDGSPLWVSVQAVGLLCAAQPREAQRIAATHLASVDGQERDAAGPGESPSRHAFVLRASMLRHLASSAGGEELLVAHARRRDPSEWVRQRLVDGLLAVLSQPAEPSVLAALEGATDPGREPAVRVRAYAARRLAALLGGVHTQTAFAALRRAVTDDDLLVRRVAAESLRGRAAEAIRAGEPAKLAEHAIAALLCLLTQRREAPATSAAEAAALADAVEMLRLWTDPVGSDLARSVGASLRCTPELETAVVPLPAQLDEAAAGRVLAAMAQDGLGLYATVRTTLTASGERRTLHIRHGARSRPRLWRLLHEVRSLRADKRRDVPHTVGAWTPEPLRAPPARLGAASVTALPGERRQVGYDGEWGRHLPPPDDLLDLGLLRPLTARVFSSRGVTVLRPPPSLVGRLRLALNISRRLAWLGELRHRCLAAGEARTAQGGQTQDTEAQLRRKASSEAYAETLAAWGVRLEFSPYGLGDPHAWAPFPAPRPDADTALGAGLGLLGLPGLAGLGAQQGAEPTPISELVEVLTEGVTDGFVDYLASPVGNDIGQLAIFVAMTGAGLLSLSAWRQWRTEQYRNRIPLTLGGWGTRGKSSLERLKTAMLTGMGYEVLCKTTGTVPTLVYSPPWEAPVELPLFRPGDRATVWEQRDVLVIAARLGVQVLAWECMAIRPRYAGLIQREWMRDPIATLTNTYPDHEDQQGPGAVDVARSLARIAPPGGTLITGEVSMLPVVRSAATDAGCRVVALEVLEEALLPDDLMALFPDFAHRRNVALLRRLAVELGFDPDVATVEAAARVLPDIGVLSLLGPVVVGAHQVSFANAMSANDPASALESVHRVVTGWSAGNDGAVVMVANARRDRPGRSEVFARMLAREVNASLRLFTGTDSRAMLARFGKEAAALGAEITCHDEPSARAAVDTLAARVGLDDRTAGAVARAVLRTAPGLPADAVHSLAQCLLDAQEAPLHLPEAVAFCHDHPATGALMTLLEDADSLRRQRGPVLARWVAAAAPRLALSAVGRCFAAAADGDARDRGASALRKLAEQLLLTTAIGVPPDPDQVIVAALARLPPGRVLVVGMQNIKGVGCRLVRQFAVAEEIARAAANAEPGSAQPDTASPSVPTQPGATPPLLDAQAMTAAARLGLIPAAAVAAALADLPLKLPRGSEPSALDDARAVLRRRTEQRVARLLSGRRSLLERGAGRLAAPLRAIIAALLTPALRLGAAWTMRRLAGRRISPAEARRRLERLVRWQG